MKCAQCQNQSLWAFQTGCTAEQMREVATSAHPGFPLRTLCWLIQAHPSPVPQLTLAGSQPGRVYCIQKAEQLAPVAPKAAVILGEPFSSESQPQLPREVSQYPSAALRAGVQMRMGSERPHPSYPWLEPLPGRVPGTWLVDNKNERTESQTVEGVPRHYPSLMITKLLLPVG